MWSACLVGLTMFFILSAYILMSTAMCWLACWYLVSEFLIPLVQIEFNAISSIVPPTNLISVWPVCDQSIASHEQVVWVNATPPIDCTAAGSTVLGHNPLLDRSLISTLHVRCYGRTKFCKNNKCHCIFRSATPFLKYSRFRWWILPH
jgi:hypothetical protein